MLLGYDVPLYLIKLARLLRIKMAARHTQKYQPNRGLLPPSFGGALLHPRFFFFFSRGKCTQTVYKAPLTTEDLIYAAIPSLY
jgi:hypothetical protein